MVAPDRAQSPVERTGVVEGFEFSIRLKKRFLNDVLAVHYRSVIRTQWRCRAGRWLEIVSRKTT